MAIASLLLACEPSLALLCTQPGCSAGVAVTVLLPPGTSDGTYEFTVTTDVGVYTCACTLSASMPCPGVDTDTEFGDDAVEVVSISQSGRAIELLVFVVDGPLWGGPERVRLQLTRDGASVLDQTLVPMYEGFDVQPDPERSGRCEWAEATVRLEAPSRDVGD